MRDLPIDDLGQHEPLGSSSQTYRIPDAYAQVFAEKFSAVIPGFAWVTQDEISAIPSLPIGQTDVTGLTASLAGKYDKTGGTITGAVTATGAIAGASLSASGGIVGANVTATTRATVGAVTLNGGGFTNGFDTDVWVAGVVRTAPSVPTQGYYGQHRINGDAGGQVHDALAAEIRLSSITNATFLNSIEASTVVSGGTNTIGDMRAITANVTLNSGAGGTVTGTRVIAAQTVVNASSATLTTVYGIYADVQTAGATNYNIYAPTGTTHLGVVETEGDLTVGSAGTGVRIITLNGASANARDIQIKSGGVLRWILRVDSTGETGSNAGSDFSILARTDAGAANVTPLSIKRSNGAISISNVPIGFYGATAVAKQTVTGAKGSNAALGSLMTALSTLGLVTDSTTA